MLFRSRHAAIETDLTFIGLLLTGDQPKKRGFARPIRAHKTDLFAALQSCGGFNEHDLVSILLTDIVNADHLAGGLFVEGIESP